MNIIVKVFLGWAFMHKHIRTLMRASTFVILSLCVQNAAQASFIPGDIVSFSITGDLGSVGTGFVELSATAPELAGFIPPLGVIDDFGLSFMGGILAGQTFDFSDVSLIFYDSLSTEFAGDFNFEADNGITAFGPFTGTLGAEFLVYGDFLVVNATIPAPPSIILLLVGIFAYYRKTRRTGIQIHQFSNHLIQPDTYTANA